MRLCRFVVLTCIFLCLFPLIALGEVIDLPELEYDYNAYMLQHDNQIHVLLKSWDGEKGQCYELKGDFTLAPCTLGCAENTIPFLHTDVVCADAMTYKISEDGCLYQWTPDAESLWTKIVALDGSGLDLFNENGDEPVFIEALVQDDSLYYAYCLYEDRQSYLYRFQLSDGKREEIDVYSNTMTLRLCNGYDHQILLDGQITSKRGLHIFDTDTRKATFITNSYPDMLLYFIPDGQGKWLSNGSRGLYSMDAAGKCESLLSMPLPNSSATYPRLTSNHQFFFFISSTSSNGTTALQLYFLPVQPQNVPQLGVVGRFYPLEGRHDALPSLAGFLANHDDAVLNQLTFPGTFDEIAAQLTVNSDSFDLMIMSSSSDDVTRLRDKGYYRDLSDLPEVAAYVDQLYPMWRDFCCKGDEIWALPVMVSDCTTMLYNATLWEQLELGPLPTDFSSLLDFVERWCESDLRDDYYLFGSPRGGQVDSYYYLYQALMNYYPVSCRVNDQPLQFDTETFVGLLTRLNGLRDILKELDADVPNLLYESYPDDKLPLLFPYASTSTFSDNAWQSTSSDFASMAADSQLYRALPLSITPEQEPMGLFDLAVIIVNPSSSNMELVTQLLSYIAANPTATTKCTLLQGQPQGIRSQNYEEQSKRLEASLKALDDDLLRLEKEYEAGNLTPLEIREYREGTEHAKQLEKRMVEAYMWAATPETTDLYYQFLPYAHLMYYNDHDFFEDEANSILQRFLVGTLTPQQTAQKLDELVRMVTMEDQ